MQINIQNRLNEVTSVIPQIRTAFASAQRLFEVLGRNISNLSDAPDAIAFHHCKGEVDISHLSFSYSPETKLIEDFNRTSIRVIELPL